jgi:hypothetical protein
VRHFEKLTLETLLGKPVLADAEGLALFCPKNMVHHETWLLLFSFFAISLLQLEKHSRPRSPNHERTLDYAESLNLPPMQSLSLFILQRADT